MSDQKPSTRRTAQAIISYLLPIAGRFGLNPNPLEAIIDREMAQERAAFISQLAECYRLSGADPNGNEDWRLAEHAVEEVGRLRKQYDERQATETRSAELRAALLHAQAAFETMAEDAQRAYDKAGTILAWTAPKAKDQDEIPEECSAGDPGKMAEFLGRTAPKEGK